jgi:hypothetical protein
MEEYLHYLNAMKISDTSTYFNRGNTNYRNRRDRDYNTRDRSKEGDRDRDRDRDGDSSQKQKKRSTFKDLDDPEVSQQTSITSSRQLISYDDL